MKTFRASLRYFLLVFSTGFVLGAVRVPFLVPRLGERHAELLEMPVMLVAIVLAARHVVRRFRLTAAPSSALTVGCAALILLIMAELVLAVTLQDRSLGEYIASRDPLSGSVYLAMLLVFAAMPVLVARRHPAGR